MPLDYYPYTFENRPAPSDDPKYKASADEVNANFKAVLNAIAFFRQEVDVSLASADRNFSTPNTESGASTTTKCNLTHLLGDLFRGKLSGVDPVGDTLGVMDADGRFWIVRLAHDDQISFGESSGGGLGKCSWQRLDGGAAYANYNDETWMNTLTVWTISRSTDYSNVSMKVTKDQILLGIASSYEMDAADIPITDTLEYFATHNVEVALEDCGRHLADASDPHGATLTQTNLVVTGTISLATLNITGNFSVNTDKFSVAASTGNTVVAGTLQVAGAVTFNNNVTISAAYVLTIGTGGITSTGDIVTTTQVKTPQLYNAGNIIIDAYNVAADSAVYIKNSAASFRTDLRIDGRQYFDLCGTPIFFQPEASWPILYLNLNTASNDSYFVIRNTETSGRAWLSVQTGIKFAYSGGAAISMYKTSDIAMEFDIKHDTLDTTFYLKNTGTNRKANMDISGILTVAGVGDPNIGIYGNVHEVVDARDIYATLDDRLDAMQAGITQAGTPSFLDLTDTPSSYTGAGGMLVKVNSAENGLEFVLGSAGGVGGTYAQTVIVAKSGGQFNSVQSAINSISDNGPTKPYIVLIYPGRYIENLTMKNYVFLVGIDRNSCLIEASVAGYIISISDPITTGFFNLHFKSFLDSGGIYVNHASADVIIRNCTVETSGTTASFAIRFASPTIQILDSQILASYDGIYADASGSVMNCEIRSVHIGIIAVSGSPEVLGCTVRSTTSAGMQCTSSGSPKISFCDIIADNDEGITITGGMPKISHVNIQAHSYGISSVSTSKIEISNSYIVSSNDSGIYLLNSSAVMDLTDSKIRGASAYSKYGITDYGNGSQVSSCHIEGGIFFAGILSKYSQCYIKGTYANTEAVWVESSATDLGLHLLNCILKSDGTGRSVNSGFTPKSLRMCNCTVNADVGDYITVDPCAIYQTTNVKNANI
jgi:hypothetical protein